MTKDKLQKEANKYTGKDKCFVHVENSGDGKGFHLIIAGDGIQITCAVTSIIERISAITNAPFEKVVEHLTELHNAMEKERDEGVVS